MTELDSREANSQLKLDPEEAGKEISKLVNCVWHRVKRAGKISSIRSVREKLFPGRGISMSPEGTRSGSRYTSQSLACRMNGRWTGASKRQTMLVQLI